MKKILALLLIAGLAAFAACGHHGKNKEKAKQDSIRKDSIAKVKMADSLATIDKERERLDSLKKDSTAKAKKKNHTGKPKPKHKPTATVKNA